MALSLESIYQPLNDFFVQRFATPSGSSVVFRFDKFGSVLSEEDFIDDRRPDLGYLPALASEKFTDLVNRVPLDAGDGVNIILSSASIDDMYYFRLVSPSVPFIPMGSDEVISQAIVESFSTLKAQAFKVWEKQTRASISDPLLEYKLSTATPEDWYDISRNDVWTRQTFEISDTSVESSTPPTDLWRLKLDDPVVAQVLQLPEMPLSAPEPTGIDLAARAVEVQADRVVFAGAAPTAARRFPEAALARTAAARAPLRPLPLPIDRPAPVMHSVAVASQPDFRLHLHETLLGQTRRLDMGQRVLVNEVLGESAPTQPARTNRISVSFDYCLVTIRRAWYVDAFINGRNWWIPSVAKGELTEGQGPGTFSSLPIGFVAIKRLVIDANWADEDIENASIATDFGPFRVAGDVASGSLSHPGLQIIGWLLQKLPSMPPNDPQ